MREYDRESSRFAVAAVSFALELGLATEVDSAAAQVGVAKQDLFRSRPTLHPDLLPGTALSASADYLRLGASMLNVLRWRFVGQDWKQSFPATCGPSANKRSSPLRSLDFIF